MSVTNMLYIHTHTHIHGGVEGLRVLLVISSWYTNTKDLCVWRRPPSLPPFIPQAEFLSSDPRISSTTSIDIPTPSLGLLSFVSSRFKGYGWWFSIISIFSSAELILLTCIVLCIQSLIRLIPCAIDPHCCPKNNYKFLIQQTLQFTVQCSTKSRGAQQASETLWT